MWSPCFVGLLEQLHVWIKVPTLVACLKKNFAYLSLNLANSFVGTDLKDCHVVADV